MLRAGWPEQVAVNASLDLGMDGKDIRSILAQFTNDIIREPQIASSSHDLLQTRHGGGDLGGIELLCFEYRQKRSFPRVSLQ